VENAFGGIPIETVRAELDARLPPEVPVALDASILGSVVWHPRLVEGLYPRRVDRTSPHVLAMSTGPPADPSSVLASVGNRTLILEGMLAGRTPGSARAPPRLAERLELSWLRFAACCAGVAGWGALAWILLAKLAERRGAALERPSWSVLVLLASATFACAVTAATWLQLGIAWPVVTLGGILLSAFAAVRAARRGWRESLRVLLPREDLVLAVLLALLLFHMSRNPVVDPDGRSIWLFHAKQVFASGCFDRGDLLHPDLRWTHPGYPLLVPAWLVQFTSLEGAYDERMASLGIPILLAAVLGVLGAMLRESIGRTAATLTVAGLFLVTESLAANAQADGFLYLFLLVGLVGIASPRWETVGWAALASASLTKQEGLVFALVVAVLFVAFHSKARARPWAWRIAPLLVLAPAVLHEAWTHWIGIVGAYHDIRWAEVPSRAPHRLSVVLAAIPSMLGRRPGLWVGAIGLAASLPWVFRSGAKWEGRAAIASGLAFLAFAVAILVVSPFRIGWHVETALGRLLLHPAYFFAIAPLLLLGDGAESPRRALTPPR
jgi:hypothetical protein